MNIVVTGALGFIGKHLIRRLDSQGHALWCCDIKSGRADWEWLPGISKADFIFHLASPVGCRKVMLERGVYSNIIRGAAAAIECADRLGAKLVAFSSAEAEAHLTWVDRKRAEYPKGKAMMEKMCLNSPCDVTIIRPHNVIGPGQDPDAGFVVPRFMRSKYRGAMLNVFGTGTQKRVFTSVHDIVDFCLLIIHKSLKGHFLFELGTNENAVSINELAQMIGGDINHTSGAENYGILHYSDMPSRSKVDTSTAEAFGWAPKWKLPEILKEIEDEYRNDRTQPATADATMY